MDFIEASLRSSANMGHAAAREIALALGVPPMLLGIPGDFLLAMLRMDTFSNYQEANRTFWRNTVVPLISRAADSLSDWLGPAFGDIPLKLAPDLDEIEALAPEREALWARLEKTSFLTIDEKRAVIGYGPLPAPKFNPYHDDRGRFDFGPSDVHPVANAPKDPIQGKPRGQGGESAGGGGGSGMRSTGDILKPGGKDIGTGEKGAGEGIRTVSPAELEALEKDLLGGSTRQIVSPQGYDGKWYLREDGSIVGVRSSAQYGKTLDVVDPAGTGLERGYKVHAK